MIISMSTSLDRILEVFLENVGGQNPLVNEEVIIDAFYEGARIACLVTVLQEARSESEFDRILEEGMSTIEELTMILELAGFEEANGRSGNC